MTDTGSGIATAAGADTARGWPGYRALWRWHFYAGLFCLPFVVWLSITGSLYLFKPQIDAWLDRPYTHLTMHGPRAAAAQVHAALAAVPGSVLDAYQLPAAADSAVQVLVARGTDLFRVYLRPDDLRVLHVVNEDRRFTRLLFHLHGELLLGDRGSMLVELAASWAIVLLLTGLYLWWPRRGGIAGVLYPRLGAGGRLFWRDLHAVTGFWVSVFALFLLVSGLPWAKSWGGLLKDVRQLTAVTQIRQDWTTGSGAELAARRAAFTAARHHGHAHTDGGADYTALDRLVAAVAPLHLAPPVLITPPTAAGRYWNARSDAQNRPLRTELTLAAGGAVIARRDFAQRPLLDRIIGTGVAAHEGQLFGWPNQLLGLFTAVGLIALSISAAVLWWRRRPAGLLGAPPPLPRPRMAKALIGTIMVLAVLLPLLGLSLLTLTAAERWLLRRLPAARLFLGLPPISE